MKPHLMPQVKVAALVKVPSMVAFPTPFRMPGAARHISGRGEEFFCIVGDPHEVMFQAPEARAAKRPKL